MFGYRSWMWRVLLAGGPLLLPAAAQAEVRYIASTGDDANPCTRAAAPCRTLQHGVDVTPGGGELRVLDSGDFGNVTIRKSLTVSADNSSIFGSITIDEASAIVALRGLDLSGATLGPFEVGITIAAASAVHVDHCTAERFPDDGLHVAAQNASVFVTDSVFRDNGGAGLSVSDASHIGWSPGLTRASIDNSRFENNAADGLLLSNGNITISRSILSGNGGSGVAAGLSAVNITDTAAFSNGYAGYLLQASVSIVDSSAAEHNQYGLAVNGTPDHSITISNSTFVNNTTWGIQTVGEVTARTRGNNTVVNNPTNVNGTLTPLAGR